MPFDPDAFLAKTGLADRPIPTPETSSFDPDVFLANNAPVFDEHAWERDWNTEHKSNFRRGLESGWDQTAALGHGFAGLAKSAVGNKEGAQASFDAYQEKMDEASLNPLDVPTFFKHDGQDANSVLGGEGNDISRFMKWASGQAGQLLPTMAEFALSGIAGGAAGSQVVPGVGPDDVVAAPLGVLAGVGGKEAMKKMVAETAEKYMKKAISEGVEGYTREMAQNAAAQAIRKQVGRSLGSQAATLGFSTVVEGGGDWAQEYEKGYDNPWSALALGLISGTTETKLGVGGRLNELIAGKGIKETFKLHGAKPAAGVLWETLKNAGEEGSQEFVQQFLQGVNSEINDPNYRITDKSSFMDWAEAGMSGVLMGGITGGLGGGYNAITTARESRKQRMEKKQAIDLANEEFIDRLGNLGAEFPRGTALQLNAPEYWNPDTGAYTTPPPKSRAGMLPQHAGPSITTNSGEIDLTNVSNGPNTIPQPAVEDALDWEARARRLEGEADRAINERIHARSDSFMSQIEKSGVIDDSVFAEHNAGLIAQVQQAMNDRNPQKVDELFNVLEKKARNRASKLRKQRKAQQGNQTGEGATSVETSVAQASLAGSTSVHAPVSKAKVQQIVDEMPDEAIDIECTKCARYIVEQAGLGQVVGYSSEDNPSAKVGNVEGGHDFALIAGRYIADPWYKNVWDNSAPEVLDLQNDVDAAIAKELYGDQSAWKILDGQTESTTGLVPTTSHYESLEEIGDSRPPKQPGEMTQPEYTDLNRPEIEHRSKNRPDAQDNRQMLDAPAHKERVNTPPEPKTVKVMTVADAQVALEEGNKVKAGDTTYWVESTNVKWGEAWLVTKQRDGENHAMQMGGAVELWSKAEAIRNALGEIKSILDRQEMVNAAPKQEKAAGAEAKPAAKEQRQERRKQEKEGEDAELDSLFKDLKKLRSRLYMGVDPEVMIVGTKIAAVYIKKGVRNFRDFATSCKDRLGDDWDAFKKYLHSFWSAAMAENKDESYFDDIEDLTYKQALAVVDKLDQQEVNTNEGPDNEPVRDNVPNADEGTPTERMRGNGGNGSASGGAGGRGGIRQPRGRNGHAGQSDSGKGKSAGTGSNPANEHGKTKRSGDTDRRTELKRDPRNRRNYRITDADDIGGGGWKQKARDNVEAIKVLHRLAAEGREATLEEKQKLVKYVGWGASELANGMFPDPRTGAFRDEWKEMAEELELLLTDKEYDAARRSTLNAHYTSPKVIRGIYNALERFGFDGGKMLEPGAGVGHFIGLMPEAYLDNSIFTGVELDPISARIAQALYPDADVRNTDYTKFSAPDGFYDVAVGNPPFANIKIVSDRRYRDKRFMLHDYFFAKSIDKVRPGGLLVFVTSKGTMDKIDDKARRYLAEQADLLGAIRLPQTAFKANAGTDVVTDVIFLRKRQIYEQPAGEAWNDIVEVNTPDGPASVNEYFKNHPEMVLGSLRLTGSMYRANELTVEANAGVDIEDAFVEAVMKLPANVYQGREVEAKAAEDGRQLDLAPDHIKEDAYFLGDDGEVYQKINGGAHLIKVRKKRGEKGVAKTHAVVLRSYIPLRDAVRDVLYKQVTGADDADLKKSQVAAEKLYHSFVKKHGPINKSTRSERINPKTGKEIITVRYPNVAPLSEDPDVYLIASIEQFDEETGKVKGLSGLMTKRIIGGEKTAKIETVQDALGVTLDRLGRVDISMIAGEMDLSEQEAIDSLGNSIFRDPEKDDWVTDDEYLSGNVKRKLEEAQTAAKVDKQYARNVTALEKVQPKPLEPAEITISLGMPIVKAEYIEKYIEEVMGLHARIHHDPALGKWAVVPKRRNETDSDKATVEWGGGNRNAFSLLDSALNQKSVRIMKTVWDNGKRKDVFDAEATEAANEKLTIIKESFRNWIFNDHERTKDLVTRYNEVYNTDAPRQYNGEHLSLPGINTMYKPYPHQKNVAWRIIQNGNTYMAHEVGAGKTIASVIAGMEMKRLGIIKKPQYVVPNHMLKQFSSELLDLYPAAKILVADEQQFSKQRRNRFMGRVAAEEWDAIIITHSAFKKIPISPDFEMEKVGELLDELRDYLREAQNEDDRVTVKNLEAMIKRQEEKLAKLATQAGKDKGVFFEDTGIDFLFVDEAHEFRKLSFATNMSSLKGIDPNGSEMAWDLYMKSRYLETRNPNRSLVLMSGTPITNTMGELYTVLRYLSEPVLQEADIHHFDAWAATFGEEKTRLEATPGGTYQPVSRFSSFHNIGDLARLWSRIGDVIKTRDLPYMTEKLPKLKGGQRTVVIAKQTDTQVQYKQMLNARLEAIKQRKGPPKKGDDIVLSVITDGRHAAIDQRFVSPNLPADPESKLEVMIKNVYDIWNATKKDKLTQMIFSDLGVPSSLERRGFSVYLQIRDELIRRGVPANEIAFMQDYKSHEKKRKLFKSVNKGDVRVLIGSSKAMGTGVNAQRKLVALHHLDAPWYPADLIQREGRIIRQGNTNKEAEVLAYLTKGSFDETMWQLLETKQRFIDQIMAGDASLRVADDIDTEADLFALAKAMSSDNPLVLELAGLESDIARLERLRQAHINEQYQLRKSKDDADAHIEKLRAKLPIAEKALAKQSDTKGDKFEINLDGTEYKNRKDAAEALRPIMEKAVMHSLVRTQKEWWRSSIGREYIGTVGSFKIFVRAAESPSTGRIEVTIGTEYDKEGGVDQHTEVTSEVGPGTIRQIENTANYSKMVRDIRDSIAESETKRDNASRLLDKKFSHEDTLAEKKIRVSEIRRILDEEAKEKKKQAEQDANNAEADEQDGDAAYRMEQAVGADRTQELEFNEFTEAQKRKAIAMLRRMLGDKINVQTMAEKIMTPAGQAALGQCRQAWITLVEGRGDITDTALHEAVHAAVDMFLSPEEKTKLLESVNGDEEALAEGFVQYSKDRKGLKGKVKAIAGKLLRILRTLFGGPTPPVDRITRFYEELAGGIFVGRQASARNQPMYRVAEASATWHDAKRTKKILDSNLMRVYEVERNGHIIYETSIKYGGTWHTVQYASTPQEARGLAYYANQPWYNGIRNWYENRHDRLGGFAELTDIAPEPVSQKKQSVDLGKPQPVEDLAKAAESDSEIRFRTERMAQAVDGDSPTKGMYDQYAKGKTVKEHVVHAAKTIGEKVNGTAKDWFETLSNRFKELSPEAYQRIKRLMAEIDVQDAEDLKVYQQWRKAKKAMSKEDRRKMDLAVTNADSDMIHQLIGKYGRELGAAYDELRAMLDKFLDRMQAVGLEVNRLKSYHPRIVKDHIGLLSYLKGTENWTYIEQEINRRNAMLQDSGNKLTEEEKAIIADKMLRGTIPGIPAAKTKNTKQRKFSLVTPEMMDFYAKPDDALAGYVRQNNRTIEWLRMFGAVDVETGRKLRHLSDTRKRLTDAVVRERELQAAMDEALHKGDKVRAEAIAEALKEATDYVFKQRGALEKVLGELGFDGSGSLSDGAKFIETSIGAIANRLAEQGKLTAKQSAELKKLIDALWNDMGITNPLLSGYRDLTLAAALGQWSAAITQIQDNAWSMFQNGAWHTSKAYGKALARMSRIKRDSFSPDIMPEFSHTEALSWVLNNILRWTGMSFLDSAGKESLANASLAKMQENIRKAKTGDKKAEAAVRELLAGVFASDEFYQVMVDLLNGDPDNHNVKLFSHYMVSQYQPLNRAETPAAYHGNNRFFYMLKTYQIKQLNNYREQLGGRLKKAMVNKDWESAAEAMRAIVTMGVWLALLGAGANALKDLVYGRKISPNELSWDVAGQLIGISRWDAYNIRREGVSSALLKRIVPQNKIIDSLYKDLTQPDTRGLQSAGLFPVVGKFYYWRWGRGAAINMGEKNGNSKAGKSKKAPLPMPSGGFKGFSGL
ncbi:MAG: hypothetical protein JW713_05875 [Pontiellaceae bacterium]|nr:hypothetical protein [Pontiellaceae bacterium]